MSAGRAGFLGGRYAIAGVGETDCSRDSGRTPLTLAVQAARATLGDAGKAASEVDGFLSYAESDSADGLHVASAPGARPTFGMAGLSPRDVDVAGIYDCFTFTVVIQTGGIRLPSRLVGVAPAEVSVGMVVEVDFAEVTPDCAVPVFRPARAAREAR